MECSNENSGLHYLSFEVLVKYEGGSVAEWLGHCNVFSIFSYRVYKEINNNLKKKVKVKLATHG